MRKSLTLTSNEYAPEVLYEMFRRSMEPYINAARGTPWSELRERTQFLEQLVPQSIQLVRINNAVVAYIDLRMEGPCKNIHTFIVMPEHQSGGVGTAVMDLLKATSQCITLSVLKANSRAWAFYERNGFHEASSSQHHRHLCWAPNRALDRTSGATGPQKSHARNHE